MAISASSNSGGVYERAPRFRSGATRTHNAGAFVHTERRKATGAVLHARPLTEYLVRRTLAPARSGRNGGRDSRRCACSIRRWAAARFSSPRAVTWPRPTRRRWCGRVDRRPRTSARRTRRIPPAVAQRCLYGVDINPMAVQLGRLSLWLATLVVGSAADVSRSPSARWEQPRRRRRSRTSPAKRLAEARIGLAGASALRRRCLRRRRSARQSRRDPHRAGAGRHARTGARQGAGICGAMSRRT